MKIKVFFVGLSIFVLGFVLSIVIGAYLEGKTDTNTGFTGCIMIAILYLAAVVGAGIFLILNKEK